jgi:hypothetical protein
MTRVARLGPAGQNIGLGLPKVCRWRDEAPNPQGAEPIAIRGATPASNEKHTRKPLKPRTFDEPQLHNAGRRCGRSNRNGRQPSQPNARQYLLRHALELAFLVVSGNSEQDRRRSSVDISL